MRIRPPIACGALGLAGCTSTIAVDARRLSFLEVTSSEVFPGTEAAPAPFSADPVDVALRVRALDRDAQPLAVDAVLGVRVRPGTLDGPATVTLVDGAWEGTVTFRYGFGPTRVWFADDREGGDRVPTWVAAVSDPLWSTLPTLAQIQASEDHETNPLAGEFAEVRTADRRVVVTAVGADGLWLTDLADPPGDYNALYVYTFNKPGYTAAEEGEYGDEEERDVRVGDRLTVLSGIDQEYLATTQIAHPTYAFGDDAPAPVPDPVVLDAKTACDDRAMERLEASLVRAEGATIPTGEAAWADWAAYGQWPLALGGCTLWVESSGTVPDWSPPDHAGETLSHVQGMLSEVWGSWILLPRDPSDIAGASGARRAARGPARARPRPRPTPGAP